MENTFSIHHHEPSSPSQFAGGLHYSHYQGPDEAMQQSLGIGAGFQSQQRSLGLYTAPTDDRNATTAAAAAAAAAAANNKNTHKNGSAANEPIDSAFHAAYAYTAQGGGAATFASFVSKNRSGGGGGGGGGGSGAGGAAAQAQAQPQQPAQGADFNKVELDARPALPIYSTYSRTAVAADLRDAAAAAAAASSRFSKSPAVTAALAPSGSSKRSARHGGSSARNAAAEDAEDAFSASSRSPLLDSLRSSAFPSGSVATPFRVLFPAHPRVAWVEMGRIWFVVVGTHRGSLELYRLPLWRFSQPVAELSLRTEPITALQVCQKLGVIVSASMDGSIFVSSLAMTPFTFPSPKLPSWAHDFPTVSGTGKEQRAGRRRGTVIELVSHFSSLGVVVGFLSSVRLFASQLSQVQLVRFSFPC